MRRLIRSRLIRIDTVCIGICTGLQGSVIYSESSLIYFENSLIYFESSLISFEIHLFT